MEMRRVVIVDEPTVEIIASMTLRQEGLYELVDWLMKYDSNCLDPDMTKAEWWSLFPHRALGRESDNELLVELAGRKCYNSFGLKAGRKSNADYIANTQQGDIPHASILYHAKFTTFIAGVSRRVSHELIRNYVGADRDEEGSPSQESTRYVDNPGHFVLHPGDIENREGFRYAMQQAYDNYCLTLEAKIELFKDREGREPKGLERKRIREACSGYLPHQVATSFIWTTNPMAFAKMCRERDNEFADAEFQRFIRVWKEKVVSLFPNLFPQPWMKE